MFFNIAVVVLPFSMGFVFWVAGNPDPYVRLFGILLANAISAPPTLYFYNRRRLDLFDSTCRHFHVYGVAMGLIPYSHLTILSTLYGGWIIAGVATMVYLTDPFSTPWGDIDPVLYRRLALGAQTLLGYGVGWVMDYLAARDVCSQVGKATG